MKIKDTSVPNRIVYKPRERKRFPDIIGRIQDIMKELKLKQVDVANAMEIDSRYVSSMLLEKKPFSIEHMIRFAQKYKVSLNWLLLGEGAIYFEQPAKNALDKASEKQSENVLDGSYKLAILMAENPVLLNAIKDLIGKGTVIPSLETPVNDDSSMLSVIPKELDTETK
jgi:transcriptional regulator with XRE-family HTH domain